VVQPTTFAEYFQGSAVHQIVSERYPAWIDLEIRRSTMSALKSGLDRQIRRFKSFAGLRRRARLSNFVDLRDSAMHLRKDAQKRPRKPNPKPTPGPLPPQNSQEKNALQVRGSEVDVRQREDELKSKLAEFESDRRSLDALNRQRESLDKQRESLDKQRESLDKQRESLESERQEIQKARTQLQIEKAELYKRQTYEAQWQSLLLQSGDAGTEL